MASEDATFRSLAWARGLLDDLDRHSLRRRLSLVADRRPGQILFEGQWRPNFTGNDYLGLSQHPRCVEAAIQRCGALGCGSSGSRVVTGGVPPHEALEAWLGREHGAGCLVFPTGYQANVGVLSALVGAGDTIHSDAHNHASIVDGCRLSQAQVSVYPHLRWEVLEERLQGARGRQVIVTDTVFSMDGSLAPVRELARLARAHDALLVVDEAHAVGVLGPRGKGLCAAEQVSADVLVGTFSKGLGSHGAFTAAHELLTEVLVNRARSLIYTTALPPAVLGASLAALELVAGSEGAQLRQRVLRLAEGLRTRLTAAGHAPSGHATPIVSLEFDDPTRASALQRDVLARGYLVWAFRPPTVPVGTSRLRISVSAAHRETDVEGLANALLGALGSGA